ncbi:SDR family oxidoreductase [Stutzerimonas nosocomialis]|uniref:SDR family NAD(P)-dependent oxidoreductase n=1 Tax=Stutzerimonas nosocomialis TaxID=1056496 RepID=UPI0011085050|nr:SDR family oxidoreductase [Stutzerimonas nosocomialis]TLX56718.1 SDR family oxidoreductase [Stutzerimonas nosocomialis]
MNASIKGTALITGASTGIGAVYADRLAGRGHPLLLVARDVARLQALAERLTARHGVEVEVLPADLTDPAALRRLEERLRGDGSIEVLVNNAGMSMTGALAEADLALADRMIALNLVAVTHLAAAAAANFGARGRGTVINLGSVVSLLPERFSAVYAATKAYVLSLSQSMQAELGKRGVRVQAVLPGMTRTEIWARSGVAPGSLPESMIMEADEMVDAALAGLDQGEPVTLPSLPDAADWDAFLAARAALGPNLSHRQAADRYRCAAPA